MLFFKKLCLKTCQKCYKFYLSKKVKTPKTSRPLIFKVKNMEECGLRSANINIKAGAIY